LQVGQYDYIKPQTLGLVYGHDAHRIVSSELMQIVVVNETQKGVAVTAAAAVKLAGGVNQIAQPLSTEIVERMRRI
jgi:hypothetical protein